MCQRVGQLLIFVCLIYGEPENFLINSFLFFFFRLSIYNLLNLKKSKSNATCKKYTNHFFLSLDIFCISLSFQRATVFNSRIFVYKCVKPVYYIAVFYLFIHWDYYYYEAPYWAFLQKNTLLARSIVLWYLQQLLLHALSCTSPHLVILLPPTP